MTVFLVGVAIWFIGYLTGAVMMSRWFWRRYREVARPDGLDGHRDEDSR